MIPRARVRGWMLIGLVFVLLAPLAGWGRATPVAAQAPDLGAEIFSYGADQIPDPSNPDNRIRNFYLRTVAGGTTYVYAVIAVDKAGNRSAPSNRVQETPR